MPNQPATVNAAAYLQRALQLLEKPGPRNQPHSWITGREAIDIDGHPCKPESAQAQAWCTIGVIKAVTHYDPDPPRAYTYCQSILNLANPVYIANGQRDAQPSINDDPSTTFDQIRRYFQKGIALAIKWEAKP